MVVPILFDTFKRKIKRFEKKKSIHTYDWYDFFHAYCIALLELEKEPDFTKINLINSLFIQRQLIIAKACDHVNQYKEKFYDDKRAYEREIKNFFIKETNKIDAELRILAENCEREAIISYQQSYSDYEEIRTRLSPLTKERFNIYFKIKPRGEIYG